MGLTIYYSLRAARHLAPDLDAAVGLLERLRSFCLDQNFLRVGSLSTYASGYPSLAPEAYESADRGERIIFGQSAQQLLWHDPQSAEPEVPKGIPRDIMPTEAAFFPVDPAEGCETALLGLGAYPVTLGGETTKTKDGWYWRAFCKTQYAGVAGIEAFLEAHLGLISIFDHAVTIGIEPEVRDDGEYWETRDVKVLREKLEHMNRVVARVAGVFKDVIGEQLPPGHIQAPIFKHPKFEHLEAEGAEECRAREEE